MKLSVSPRGERLVDVLDSARAGGVGPSARGEGLEFLCVVLPRARCVVWELLAQLLWELSRGV